TLIGMMIVVAAVAWSGPFQLLIGRDPLPLRTSVTHATLWQLAAELKDGQEMPTLREALKNYPRHQLQGRMYVQENYADYLIWSLPEKAAILVYSHAHLFTEPVWHDYTEVNAAEPGWEQILRRYQVNLIAIDPGVAWRLAEKLRQDSDWAVVLDDGSDS